MTPAFELAGVGMRYNGTDVLDGINLRLDSGLLAAIVGPNGAGKSTLLGIMAGLRDEYRGNCRFRGTELRKWRRRDYARKVSFVPQSVTMEFPFTAEQVVLMGRAPFSAGLFETETDYAAAHEAMQLTGSLPFRDRDFRSLSGGERQRVILASALAQSPEALLLDEPTTYLDLQHQVALYRVLRTLRDRGVLVVTVTHDLNLAAGYADRVVVLSAGEVAADGPPSEALRPECIARIFEVEVGLTRTPSGRPWIVYGE
ncbi:MAG TPA: ABC transporter ATP-binding protein [Bryobacteraceae bacterium]|nr:ABC transporter ATP-binding protein [Bryobacteraceae bacterium]